MEFVCLGWPPDGPTLRLDYRRFAYAGKFVTSTTGTAVVRASGARGDDRAGDGRGAHGDDGDGDGPGNRDGDTTAVGADDGRGDDGPDHRSDTGDGYDTGILAAASFDADRTDPDCLRVRYVTVRSDRRGEGLGSRLLAFVATRAGARGYDRVRIAVNNPVAYRAAHRAGFAFAGEETGLAELVCERPTAEASRVSPATYRDGLDRFRERDLEPETAALLDAECERGPPDPVAPPAGVAADGSRVPGAPVEPGG